MTLDDLRRSWLAEVSHGSGSPRLDTLKAEVARLRRDVLMRDFWMLVVVGGAVFFNWWARDIVTLPSRIAVLSTVIVAVVVTFVLFRARRTKSCDNWTLRARLEREIETLGRQVSLLLNVGYWFLLPMFVMIVITSIVGQHERTGSYLPNAILWALFVAGLFISALAIWLCRREAKRTFMPLLSRLKELHRDLVDQAGDGT